MEVSNICDLPNLHEVRYKRETATVVYISFFIDPREELMGTRGTEGAVWGCEAAIRG